MNVLDRTSRKKKGAPKLAYIYPSSTSPHPENFQQRSSSSLTPLPCTLHSRSASLFSSVQLLFQNPSTSTWYHPKPQGSSHGGRRSSDASAAPVPDAARGGAPRAGGVPVLVVVPRAFRRRRRAASRGVAPPQRPLRLRPRERHRAPAPRAVAARARPLLLLVVVLLRLRRAADEHDRRPTATAGRRLPILVRRCSYSSTGSLHIAGGLQRAPTGPGVRRQAREPRGGAGEQAGARRAAAEQVGEDGGGPAAAAGSARGVPAGGPRAASDGVGERAAAAVVRVGARVPLGRGRRRRVPAHGGGVHRQAQAVPPPGVHDAGRRRGDRVRVRRALRGRPGLHWRPGRRRVV
jgi:hypothetical protein